MPYSNLHFLSFFSSLTPDEEPDGEQGDQSLKNNKNNPFLENAENVSVADSSVQIDDVSKLKTAPNSASFPSRQLVYSPESPSTSSCPPLSPQRPHPGMCMCFNIKKKNLLVFVNYFYTLRGRNWKDKMFNFEFLKSGWRYWHQIFTSCQPLWKPALCKKSRT